jgi:hypothetical protein
MIRMTGDFLQEKAVYIVALNYVSNRIDNKWEQGFLEIRI